METDESEIGPLELVNFADPTEVVLEDSEVFLSTDTEELLEARTSEELCEDSENDDMAVELDED